MTTERIDQIAAKMNAAPLGVTLADEIAFEQLVQTARIADVMEKLATFASPKEKP